MFPPKNKVDMERYFNEEPEGEFPLVYTLQIGRIFCAISLLEQTTYGALMVHATGEDFKEVHEQLRRSSFGQLVQRLAEKGVEGRHLRYLREINRIRNRFVHGFFWDYPVPGEVISQQGMTERLISHLEKTHNHFRFAEVHLWRIVGHTDSVDVIDLGEAGRIYQSKGSSLEK